MTNSHDVLRVRGARENNLQNVDVELPKRRLTAFTGVSGSGKTSLVFDTIAAESQRLINETYPGFVQSFMPQLPRPDVDVLEGLTPAISVDQQALGTDPRSTVGTATDAGTLLRILFSRLAEPHIGPPQAFSFNVASISGAGAVTTSKHGRTIKERRSFSVVGGMCPRCEGRGTVTDFNLAALIDPTKTLNEGAILVPGYSMDGWWGRIFGDRFDLDTPLGDFSQKKLDQLLYQEPIRIKVEGVNLTFEGLIPRIRKSMLSKDPEAMQPHIRAFVERAVVFAPCPECEGTRLTELARSAKIGGLSIADVSSMPISEAARWVAGLSEPTVAPLLAALRELLESFVEIGLGYLSLDRTAATLSGGEAQRTKMVRHLNSALTDVTYIFDEPTAGLHPHDTHRLRSLLLRLRDKGNTVLVVEHDPEMIEAADFVVDLGPGAGQAGGNVTFTGTVAELRRSDTVTGRHLSDRGHLKEQVRTPTGQLELRGANLHNLRGVDVDLPLGVLTAITGVAGSGKSSLVEEQLAGRDGVTIIDQSALRVSRRSSPATYTSLLDPVRSAFAKANGVKPALFSANSEGGCPQCKGAGVVTTDLGMMASVTSPCELCEGKRYREEVLDYQLGGKNIVEVLDLTAAEAVDYFAEVVPKAVPVTKRLVQVGLGYLTLGQPLSTLSGGERQRLKLAVQLGQSGDIYVLDEPTSGLHLADVAQLLTLLDQLVEDGNTVVVVEHHRGVIAHADWVIDLGPGAGKDGGLVVFTGPPAQMVAEADTLTGQHLAEYVAF
ncbi:excinuclease ABC subunit UvrA [Scrofimicrobium sp. R131]|uniref:UvrABC system protein A n=1 Tax=Scrofimicrobium appendicitidis TaxID=3079930 RepID=A0AAU7V6T4_9ACTO